MTDKPVLNTPGELLVEARKAAGLDLDQVAERTKIPVAILRSLELDEYHKISGPLYVNSFLRTYASDVGVEPSLVLESYAKFSGEAVVSSSASKADAVWVEDEVQIRRVGLPWGLIAMIVGGVAIVVVLVMWLVGLDGDSESSNDGHGTVEPAAAHETMLPESTLVAMDDPLSESVEMIGPPADSTPSEEETGSPDSNNDKVEDTAVRTRPDEAVAAPIQTPDEEIQSEILPGADAGVPTLSFGDGNRWPLVLRVLTDEPVGAQVVRDADREPAVVGWPAAQAEISPLPTIGVRHGEPYRTSQGLAVYWGARDQFSLRLDRTEGVEVSLNGEVRDISDLQPGQEIILFLPSNRRQDSP